MTHLDMDVLGDIAHDTFIRVTCLIHMGHASFIWDMTHSCVT